MDCKHPLPPHRRRRGGEKKTPERKEGEEKCLKNVCSALQRNVGMARYVSREETFERKCGQNRDKGASIYDVCRGWGKGRSPKSRQKKQSQMISVHDKGEWVKKEDVIYGSPPQDISQSEVWFGGGRSKKPTDKRTEQ